MNNEAKGHPDDIVHLFINIINAAFLILLNFFVVTAPENSMHELPFSPSSARSEGCRSLGIGTGNPGVFQSYPHPYPRKPRTRTQGYGFRQVRVRVLQKPGDMQLVRGYDSKTG
jgi:hypothetical protein